MAKARVLFLRFRLFLVLAAPALSWAAPAHAVLDVENRGPTLSAGAFAMRVTNIGSLGNPFFEQGRSFDPSFEYPRGSGNEGLKHADLWVGARVPSLGTYRVSGGPLLEWRPTLDPQDRVRTAFGGQFGAQPFVDDDGDGRVDEEVLNGRDDDGDGERDEDLGISAAQDLYAEYVDDRPEAVAYGYPGGESHVPMHLDVKQEAFTWSIPGYDRIAGVRFTVTNHGVETLEEVRLGLLADLDSRGPGQAGGHLNDRVGTERYEVLYNDGVSSVPSFNAGYYGGDYIPWSKPCIGSLSGEWPVVFDGVDPTLPAFGVLPLRHSLDPMGVLRKSGLLDFTYDPYVNGLGSLSFRYSLVAMELPPGEGGPPIFDPDRYELLAGRWPGPRDLNAAHDWGVMISCGPFPKMPPGQSYSFDVAFVCGPDRDSVASGFARAVRLERGNWVNLQPDTSQSLVGQMAVGRSGFTGHETCFEAPPGVRVVFDPNCWQKFPQHGQYMEPPAEITDALETVMPHGSCLWVDADCDECTGFGGNETQAHWADPASVPPAPAYRAVAADHAVTVQWDNSPEVLVRAPVAPGVTSSPVTFKGYNLYRLSDWRRKQLLPGPESFQLIASFGLDTLNGEQALAQATDSTVDWSRITFGAKQYPIGRYHFTDTRALNGFDYLYVVTTVGERSVQLTPTLRVTQRFESPIVSALDSLVSPRAEAQAGGGVWVVPNPYRAGVAWDRPAIAGDPFGRHLDFMGMPRAPSRLKVFTVSGDLVWETDHDGRSGAGEVRWNLISRNGQDVESGIYVFSVDSPLGHQVGRFVVIR
ncbi:MAG: hypothetical protein IT347_13855 [Candidatus Eisenbacteria bacterium]|nr:hypothetical protein [Candidatus Eisenbacteria bacterium]